MQRLCVIAFVFTAFFSQAQSLDTDTVGRNATFENIYSRFLSGDSLNSSFCIVIKKEVKSHKHLYHSEQIVVIEGEGLMKLDDKSFKIRVGELVFIPKNSVHSVKSTGKVPLKVVSIQSPRFDGSDRVFVEEK